jgi:hypothetical protein
VKSGTEAQKENAGRVLLAISAERRHRKEAKGEQRRLQLAEIKHRVRDKGLLDRVVMAFTEVPPEEWEVNVSSSWTDPASSFASTARS